jgi:hypothetical protein
MESVISVAVNGKRCLFSEILNTDYPHTRLNICTFYCEYISIYFRYVTYIHAFFYRDVSVHFSAGSADNHRVL